jgi:hypothetical protein
MHFPGLGSAITSSTSVTILIVSEMVQELSPSWDALWNILGLNSIK